MRTYKNIIAILFILTLVVPASASASTQGETTSMPVYGAKNAPHTFVIWGGFTCPYTGQLIPILKEIVDESKGKINMEWHHYPAHQPDPALHVSSMADPSRFWDFVFATLKKTSKFGYKTDTLAMEVGKSLNIPAEKINKSQENDVLWNTVKQDYLAAELAGIKISPGLFYNGYLLTANGVPRNLGEFKKILLNTVKGN